MESVTFYGRYDKALEMLLYFQGTILECDTQLAYITGYRSPVDVMGLKMNTIIPSFTLPVHGQTLTKVNTSKCAQCLLSMCVYPNFVNLKQPW